MRRFLGDPGTLDPILGRTSAALAGCLGTDLPYGFLGGSVLNRRLIPTCMQICKSLKRDGALCLFFRFAKRGKFRLTRFPVSAPFGKTADQEIKKPGQSELIPLCKPRTEAVCSFSDFAGGCAARIPPVAAELFLRLLEEFWRSLGAGGVVLVAH